MIVRTITWDVRESPDLHELAAAIRVVSGGTVHLVEVDTGCDDYAIAVADRALTQQQAYDAWISEGTAT